MKIRFRSTLAGLLLGLATVAQASPIFYDIHFTQTIGTVLPSGSFRYDAVTNQFSSFIIRVAGTDYDLTAAGQNPFTKSCGIGATGFQIMSGQTACATEQVWNVFQASLEIIYFFATDQSFQNDPSFIDPEASIAQQFDLPETLERSNGGRFTISERVADVPEPATLALVAISLLGLGAVTRRRKP